MTVFTSVHFPESINDMGFFAHRPDGCRHDLLDRTISGVNLGVDDTLYDILLGENSHGHFIVGEIIRPTSSATIFSMTSNTDAVTEAVVILVVIISLTLLESIGHLL